MDVIDCRLTVAHCGLLIGQLDYQALLDWTGDRNVVTKVSNSIIALHVLLHHKNSTTPILSYHITITFTYQQASRCSRTLWNLPEQLGDAIGSSRRSGHNREAVEVDAIGRTRLVPSLIQHPPPTTSVP